MFLLFIFCFFVFILCEELWRFWLFRLWYSSDLIVNILPKKIHKGENKNLEFFIYKNEHKKICTHTCIYIVDDYWDFIYIYIYIYIYYILYIYIYIILYIRVCTVFLMFVIYIYQTLPKPMFPSYHQSGQGKYWCFYFGVCEGF